MGFLVFALYAGDAAMFFRLPESALQEMAVFGEGLVKVGRGHGLLWKFVVKTRGVIIAEAA